ncbi:carboxy-S-adenosyl-L-methionine synthase CmoA [Thiospirochaeta perfilievii]|uniref:Carboxy-S-adenosyl-L-methionine synthase n=1 Tax=Thiospirochaeta perfilievii TaxID=252967 RepID=A0A5C1Q9K3_9SPIO|nr:carboxy-S-adenosyl-L-methionine synthase CmoA [Thiospirochaeta perfilievii]QEN04028.1 carboxy-S-adenosyl-L-methionine synthase CmoA [Thiospirochaeta perfilievii]
MAKIDKVFSNPLGEIPPFTFNEKVAHVFDDMAERSIPFYREVQKMITDLSLTFFQEGSKIYDLGCSTATTSALVYQGLIDRGVTDFTIKGIDNSEAMCEEARIKLDSLGASKDHVSISLGDFLQEEIHDASVVIMNYTLQFTDPLKREAIIKKIYNGLRHNGILLVSDKLLQTNTDISRTFIDKYYNMKRLNGYSELEISQKREALENVLIPYTLEEETALFTQCGFKGVDAFFSWYNFTSFICIKK